MSFDSPLAPRTRSNVRRAAVIVSAGMIAAGLALGGTVAADAVPLPTLTSSAATASADGSITLTANGFTAGDALSFTLDSSALTTYPVSGTAETADASGSYSGYASIPRGLTPGAHTITVTDTTTPGATASTAIDIVAQPTSSVSPSSSALSAYLKNGVTATFSGFTPGSTVSFGISTPGTGDQAGPDAVVGPTGVVTLHFVPQAGTNYANAGTYYLSAGSGNFSVVAQPLSFTVTADPAAAPAPAPAPVATPAAPVKSTASFTG